GLSKRACPERAEQLLQDREPVSTARGRAEAGGRGDRGQAGPVRARRTCAGGPPARVEGAAGDRRAAARTRHAEAKLAAHRPQGVAIGPTPRCRARFAVGRGSRTERRGARAARGAAPARQRARRSPAGRDGRRCGKRRPAGRPRARNHIRTDWHTPAPRRPAPADVADVAGTADVAVAGHRSADRRRPYQTTPGGRMTVALIALVGVLAAALAGLATRHRQTTHNEPSRLPGETTRRILFPFVATALSRRALDAALRLASAEDAVLVPV